MKLFSMQTIRNISFNEPTQFERCTLVNCQFNCLCYFDRCNIIGCLNLNNCQCLSCSISDSENDDYIDSTIQSIIIEYSDLVQD